jgi:prepilin-type N-terminal cleavage/methylation domain-containing protein
MSQGLSPVSNQSMNTTIVKAGVRHRLIRQITSRSSRSGSGISRGFTLIELLVVVIIVGILASIALPGFLSQADKAKASSAKALVSSAVKECQVHLISGGTFTPQVAGTPEILLAPDPITCSSTLDNTYTATIVSNSQTFTGVLDPISGVVDKSCTGTNGCEALEW